MPASFSRILLAWFIVVVHLANAAEPDKRTWERLSESQKLRALKTLSALPPTNFGSGGGAGGMRYQGEDVGVANEDEADLLREIQSKRDDVKYLESLASRGEGHGNMSARISEKEKQVEQLKKDLEKLRETKKAKGSPVGNSASTAAKPAPRVVDPHAARPEPNAGHATATDKPSDGNCHGICLYRQTTFDSVMDDLLAARGARKLPVPTDRQIKDFQERGADEDEKFEEIWLKKNRRVRGVEEARMLNRFFDQKEILDYATGHPGAIIGVKSATGYHALQIFAVGQKLYVIDPNFPVLMEGQVSARRFSWKAIDKDISGEATFAYPPPENWKPTNR